MLDYMRGQFAYFGIKSGARKILEKDFIKRYGLPAPDQLEPTIRHLWQKDEREYQHFALELLYKTKKQWESGTLSLFEWMVTFRSWWDTVDMIAANLVGPFFLLFPDQKIEKCREWSGGSNIWLQRTAILFQLKYKEKTDFNLLSELILEHREDEEFFIRKAIGWALRQYAKSNPDSVIDFVHRHELSPLSEKEALKHLK